MHLHQGPRPLDPFRRYYRFGREDCIRQFRWGYGKFVGFWPKKARENPRGRASFPPGIFSCFRLNRRKSAQRTLLVSPDLTADEIPATGGHRRFVPGPAFADVACSGEHAASRRCYGKRGYAPLDDVCFRARRLSAAEPVRKAHREKGRVNPWGKQAFPLGSSRPFSCARKPQTFRSPA